MTDVYIQKVLDGDRDAFRFIIRKYKDRAFSLAISIVKNEFVAKEVVQTAFIKVYTKLATFQGKSKFSTWLFRIVINEAYQQQRKQKKNKVDIDETSLTEAPRKVSNTILKTEGDNQRYYINKALKELSAKYSLALRLFYLEEFSVKEITQITGWTKSNTKVILHRARNKMKNLLTNLFNIKKEELY